MMIHNAKVEVTCDGDGCRESVFIDLPFVYSGPMHTIGHYDHDTKAVEKRLRKEEWTVQGGDHYCSADCVPK